MNTKRAVLLAFVIGASVIIGASGSAGASGRRGPIKIGFIAAATSSLPAATQPEAFGAAQARVDAINAAGGINGHKLQLVTCNDDGDANTALTCADREISRGVVAITGNGPEETSIYPALQKAGIASIGAIPISPAIGNSPVATCFTSAVAGGIVAVPKLFEKLGVRTDSLIYPNDYGAGSTLQVTAFNMGLHAANAKLGGIAGYPSTTTDFSSVIGPAFANGAKGIYAFAPGPPTGPLVAAIQSEDPSAKIIIAAGGWLPSVAQYLGSKGNGIYAVGFQQPATSHVPGMKLFNRDMARYARSSARDDQSILAWASVWAFQQIAAKLKAVTRASVLKGFSNFSNLQTGGIYPPMSKSARHPFTGLPGQKCVANPTSVFEVVRNGKLYPVKDGQFVDPFNSH